MTKNEFLSMSTKSFKKLTRQMSKSIKRVPKNLVIRCLQDEVLIKADPSFSAGLNSFFSNLKIPHLYLEEEINQLRYENFSKVFKIEKL